MNPQDEKLIKRQSRLKLFTVLLMLLFGFLILIVVDNMLVSFLLAFVISYLLNPTINFLERRNVSRSLAITSIFLVSGVVISLAIYLFSPLLNEQLASFEKEIPKYIDGFKDISSRTEESFRNRFGSLVNFQISDRATTFLKDWVTGNLDKIAGAATKLFTVMILSPFFAFFMLRDGREISKKILSIVPNNLFELSLNLLHQINEQLGGFIRARLLESAIVGIVTWLGLVLLGFPYPIFLGVFAGVTNLIPYLGTVIGAVPAFLIAFVNKDTSLTILLLGVVYMVAQIIDMLFIIPLVVAKIVNLHPVTVVIVIIIGSQVMGVLGMIISIPVASIFKLTFNAIYNHSINFRV